MALFSVFANAVASDAQLPPSSGREAGGPFCAVYDVYAACRLLGLPTQPEELLRPQYVDDNGSTIGQILEMARSQGLYCLAAQNLTIADLRQRTSPTIIHTSMSPGSQIYDHFMLVVGIRGDRATVWDPPNQMRDVSVFDLSLIWDQCGVFLSKQPIKMAEVAGAGKRSAIAVVFSTLLAVIFLKACDYRDAKIRKLARRGEAVSPAIEFVRVALLSSALGLGLSLGWLPSGPVSPLKSEWSVRSLSSVEGSPVLSTKDVKELVSRKGAVIVDARLPDDFAAGHIDGAVNIPARASGEMRHSVMSLIPPGAKIVVYCEDSDCPYSEEVSRLLRLDGYSDVEIYTDGWLGWQGKGEH